MQTAAKLWYLEQFDIMRALSKREMMDMAKMLVDKYYKKDDPIMFPFNAQNTIYMLKEGSVKIGNYTENGEENLKYVLNAGNIFGEMALADGNANDFAVAVDDCIICALDMEIMQGMMMRNKAFNVAVYKLIGFRLRKLERKLSAIIFKDSATRITDFLKELVHDFGQQKNGELRVKNFLTNKEIAKLTFTSRQTVNSVLNKLKREGSIDYDDRYIKILNL
ncbi:Crp/Fnr family transcriptional regulator [Aureispira anguillae]|uniref:Crp/Fnr family transcriptional regulator n=1 Tax=Aureispira anguillae TaxID=2864201 RepID=A0A915YJG1_9BACT|nr:Crp/Fnr family transcriptional regulator [Aureispira anguillae]BDS14323.1 Crp/Fnr family transcriptional regulator [Aureispira anguillae]